MVRPVLNNYGSKCTSSNAVNVFNGEEAILRHFTGLDSEYTAGLVENKFGAPYMTRCAGTGGDDVLSARCQRKSLVE